jgi:2'-5' RNA ligase
MFKPNWFLAFPLDGAFVLQLPKLPSRFRLFHPDDVHMTLAFLGPCGEQGAERALAALDQCLAETPRAPVAITLGALVPMGGSVKAYTALSAVVDTGRPLAEQLLLELRDPLTEAASGRRDKRKPKPHITVARPQHRVSDEDRAAGLAWAASVDLGPSVHTLDRIALYTWHEHRREQLFRIVAERHLTPTVDGAAQPIPAPVTSEG